MWIIYSTWKLKNIKLLPFTSFAQLVYVSALNIINVIIIIVLAEINKYYRLCT